MSTVSDSLTTLALTLGKDEMAIVLPLADSYFTNIVGNPDPANVVAQSLAFQPTILAALPNIEAAAAKDAAAALKALMDTEVAALPTLSAALPPPPAFSAPAAPVTDAPPAA